jgi:uncharacterized phage infection (PIP) family protein YhgE
VADKTSTYSVKFDSNGKAVGDEAADALSRLKATVEGSQGALKDYSTSLRSLRGASDEVKAAKDELKAKIEAERSAISAASLEILKAGSSYTKLADETRKAEAAQKKLSEATKKEGLEKAKQQADALSKQLEKVANEGLERAKQQTEAFGKGLDKVGGPLSGLFAKFGSLKEAITGAGGSMGIMALGAGALAAGLAIVVGVVVSLANHVIDLTVSLAKWIVVSGDAARSAALEREAWLGSAQQAMALGHQIDALAAKVPTAKAELQKLALETNKAFAQSYVGGQGIVDTFNIIGTASAAMGEQVANQLGDIIKRAKDLGRVQIQPLDLRGTTIALKDVAAELAKTMKVSVAQAEAALRSGGVKVDAAAAALRAAVEKRFGPISAKKMISLDTLKAKFNEVLGGLTKDVNLEPLLQGLASMVKMFDASTVSGAALKNLIDIVSKELGPVFKKLAPIAQEAFVRIEIQIYRVGLALLDARDRLREAFAGKGVDNILTTANAITILNGAINVLGSYAVNQLSGIVGIVVRVGNAILLVRDIINAVKAAFTSWYDLGKQLVEGLVKGIVDGIADAKAAIAKLAEEVKKVFTGKTEIHSPSKVFERYGENLDKGVERGVDAGAHDVDQAVERMAPMPPASGGGGARASASGAQAGASVVMHFYVDARGASQAAAEHLSSSDFKTSLISALEGAMKTRGIAVHTATVST